MTGMRVDCIVTLYVHLLLLSAIVDSAPVQSIQAVTTSSTDHHPEHADGSHQKPTQEVSGCHFKNTEIALPITFSLEMPSYVMVGGHKFNLKLQMPGMSSS